MTKSKTQVVPKHKPINPNLLALKPRAVSLSLTGKNPTMDDGGGGEDRSKVKPILLDSIAKFLQSNGFSRTFNKFRSEAHLREDGGKSPAVDLEEMCLKFMASVNGTVTSDAVKQDAEKKSKHKKKNAGLSTEIQKEDENNTRTRESVLDEDGGLVKEDNAGKKCKDKKKRASHSTDVKVEECKEEGEPRIDNGKSILDDRVGLVKDDKNSDKAVVSKENKAMKKRKRRGSKDNEIEPVNVNAIDDSRPKYVDAPEDLQTEKKKLKASTNSEKSDGLDAIMKNGHGVQAQEAALVHSNGDDKNAVQVEEKSAGQKSTKKQRNGSAEPTSAKAFQRAKVEEIVFCNERLKDNSYWAKDGAETGYGAKAQEVLGQVRGRDFRHEKTKKKRGSYRGGQIDLQSHSIKFNYSDDE